MADDLQRILQEIRDLPPNDRDRLRHALDEPAAPRNPAPTDAADDVEYQERLARAGLVGRVRPRLRDQQAFESYDPIPIVGKPLSEIVVEERR
jgi:hypothetical protein